MIEILPSVSSKRRKHWVSKIMYSAMQEAVPEFQHVMTGAPRSRRGRRGRGREPTFSLPQLSRPVLPLAGNTQARTTRPLPVAPDLPPGDNSLALVSRRHPPTPSSLGNHRLPDVYTSMARKTGGGGGCLTIYHPEPFLCSATSDTSHWGLRSRPGSCSSLWPGVDAVKLREKKKSLMEPTDWIDHTSDMIVTLQARCRF
ncbi:hypothetical protein GGS23DRAFT_428903 [Durotheca rogersii]|uniref:uncharacterized protein n=1 Tax=Durotheca rogersii TaxID=419775 RepID=UPI00221E8AA2|nr:uncharacterized protein GGS23DRAFT_428903 [Durotheca rogersii]KAI5865477.1 hypothetical protein GGS23DRAFT_428903 [Durotheca rogersii]